MAGADSGLLGHLEFLYGSDAPAVLDDLQRVMHSFEGRIAARPPQPLTEKDAVLITYGDMVTDAGRTPLGSLGDFLEGNVADVVNTVHILPFYPYSSDDGFSVIDYLEVDPLLGSWGDLGRMGASFRLMFDAVLNHVSAKSAWFEGFVSGDEKYRDFFTVVAPGTDLASVFRPRALPLLTEVNTESGLRHVWTTFSADQVDLNYRNPDVLLAVVEVLLTYVARGAAVIRLDAIAFIWKEVGTACIHLPETHRIIQLLRSVLEVLAPGVILITETNVPHEENVSYFGDGDNEAHLVYNFALPPLTLHAFHSGDATVLARWAVGMEAPSPTTTFFNFLASHDGIGVGGARGYLTEDEIGELADRTTRAGGRVSHRQLGDGSRMPYELNINYLDALGDPDVDESDELVARRFLTSQAIMLSLQGLPGIYFHSLFGSRGWPEGVAATGAPRAVNRQKLTRSLIEEELAMAGSLRDLVFSGYRSLLRARASCPAFAPSADQQIVSTSDSVFGIRRMADSVSALCLHNVSREATLIDLAAVSAGSELVDLVDPHRAVGGTMELGPYESAWLVETAS